MSNHNQKSDNMSANNDKQSLSQVLSSSKVKSNSPIIAWILICTLISNSAYSLIAPFLPLEFKSKGVSGGQVGLIFGMYSVAVIICSPFISQYIARFGSANMISAGILVMGLAFIAFGFIGQMTELSHILLMGFSLRFIQGASSAFVQTTCYSIATNDFPDQKEQIVGLVEAVTGLGLIAGPIFGSFLYSLFEYQGTFTVYGTFLLLLALVIKIYFPVQVHQSSSENTSSLLERRDQQNIQIDVENTDQRQLNLEANQGEIQSTDETNFRDASDVTITRLICNARFTLAALSSALCYFTYTFMEPILAERLKSFNLTTLQIGWFFGIFPIFYIPSSVMVQLMPRWLEKRVIMITAALLSAVAFLFVGPSQIFAFPNTLLFMAIGQALAGIITPSLMIPGLPEMVESAMPRFPGQERRVNDLSSGIFNAFLGFGQVMAPAYGSFLTEAFGFRITCDYVAIICAIFALVYFCFGGGIQAIKLTHKKRKAELKASEKGELQNENGYFTATQINEEDNENDEQDQQSQYTVEMHSSFSCRMPIVKPPELRMRNSRELVGQRQQLAQSPLMYSQVTAGSAQKVGRNRLYSEAYNDTHSQSTLNNQGQRVRKGKVRAESLRD